MSESNIDVHPGIYSKIYEVILISKIFPQSVGTIKDCSLSDLEAEKLINCNLSNRIINKNLKGTLL